LTGAAAARFASAGAEALPDVAWRHFRGAMGSAKVRGFFCRTIPMSSNDPLHGVTLEAILRQLQEHYGWEELARRIDIRCFKSDPSIKSSLAFLRKTPWAREKVEALFIRMRAAG